MIRVNIELVPVGIEILRYPLHTIILGCQFPLIDEHQDLFILSGMKQAELTDYNMTEFNAPGNAINPALDLVIAALTELRDNGQERAGGEIYPGMLAPEPEEFDRLMLDLAAIPEIVTVYLYGQRAAGAISSKNEVIEEFLDNENKVDGGLLMEKWPNYIPYNLLLRLRPACYRKTRPDGENMGEHLEGEIFRRLGFREFPYAANMICGNGVCFTFHRPDGNFAHYTHVGLEIVPESEEGKKVNNKTLFYRRLRQEMKTSRLIYNRREGRKVYPYPGRRH